MAKADKQRPDDLSPEAVALLAKALDATDGCGSNTTLMDKTLDAHFGN